MMARKLHYYTHRGRRKHATTLLHRILSGLLVPLALVFAAALFTTGAALAVPNAYVTQFGMLAAALGASTARLLVAYALSLLVGIPLALLAESNRRVESVLLPIYDVLESMPVLAFFPVIILFFVKSGWLEGAAVFILFFSIIWNVVFNVIGGLKVIPQDVEAAGKVFGLSPVARLWQITLPALFPPLVTASILSLAEGWNLVIVAEALHAYAPQGTRTGDLFGIGSVLVRAAAEGNTTLLLSAMGLLVVAIAIINIAIWQPLLARAERYKFE